MNGFSRWRGAEAGGLDWGLGLAETGDAIARFPVTGLLEDLDALVALQDVAFSSKCAGSAKTAVLCHSC